MQVLHPEHPGQPDPDRTVQMPMPHNPMPDSSATGANVLATGDHQVSWFQTGDLPNRAPLAHEADDDWELGLPDDGYPGGSINARSSLLSVLAGLILSALVGLAAYTVFSASDQIATSGLVVPTVIGQSQTDATNTLTQAGFSVEVKLDTSDAGADGPAVVVGQAPPPGAEHDPSVPVVITVSGGVLESATADQTAPFELVDVTGRSRVEAEETLRNAGLLPQVQYVDVDPDSPEIGNVVAQTPQSGTLVAPGSEAVILVGRAAESTTVPTTATTSGAVSPTIQPAAPQTVDTTASTTEAASITEPSTTESTTAPSLEPGTEATAGDASTLLLNLSEQWSSGSWDQLATTVSPESLVAIQEHYEADARLLVDAASVDNLLNSCTAIDDGRTVCEVLYGRDGETARIFEIVLRETGDGVVVSTITFAGDAG